jgi:hypothetical protein
MFWKSALIMASRYPRERDEVDRKKRQLRQERLLEYRALFSQNCQNLLKTVIIGIFRPDYHNPNLRIWYQPLE